MRTLAPGFTLCFVSAISLPAQTAERQLHVFEDLRVRGADEGLAGGSSAALLVFPDGAMAIFDEPNAMFVFFDRAGKRYATFGRAGAAPGEFAAQTGTVISPTGVKTPLQSFFLNVGLIGRDTAWVFDRMQGRFTVFSRAAKLVGTANLPAVDPKSLISFTALAYYANGRVLGEHVTGSGEIYTQRDGDRKMWWHRSDSAIVVLNPDGHIEKRVATLPPNARMVTVSRPGVAATVVVPFESGPHFSVAPSGSRILYVTHEINSKTGGIYRVTVIDSRGDTVLARTYPFTGAAIDKRRADSAFKQAETHAKANKNVDAKTRAELLQGIRAAIPSVESPFEGALLGNDNTIWLRLPAPTLQSYLVLDPNGAFLGNVTIPGGRSTYVKAATRDAVWTVQRGAKGFKDIVRYRIGPEG